MSEPMITLATLLLNTIATIAILWYKIVKLNDEVEDNSRITKDNTHAVNTHNESVNNLKIEVNGKINRLIDSQNIIAERVGYDKAIKELEDVNNKVNKLVEIQRIIAEQAGYDRAIEELKTVGHKQDDIGEKQTVIVRKQDAIGEKQDKIGKQQDVIIKKLNNE